MFSSDNDAHIATLYPAIQNAMAGFAQEAAAMGFYIYFSYRTYAQQAALYAKGRTVYAPEGKVTNAKPGLSFHNYGLAVDMVYGGKGKWNWDRPRLEYMELGRIAAKYGIEHGDRGFEDLPHFQIVFGQKPEDLLACYNVNKDLKEVWSQLDLLGEESKS